MSLLPDRSRGRRASEPRGGEPLERGGEPPSSWSPRRDGLWDPLSCSPLASLDSKDMTTTTQVWHTYERIVHETLEGSERLLEEEDGQDYR